MKVVAIVQARMGSSRLPGKVLLDLAGVPVLARVIRRLQRSAHLDAVVVATTTRREDDSIQRLCDESDWPCYRGSECDVLDRYYQTALRHGCDVVVRATSDCPMIEPAIADSLIAQFLEYYPNFDYATNVLPRRTFPRGLDLEVLRFETLQKAWIEDKRPDWREHVTPYIQRNPDRFRIHGFTHPRDYSHMRWTVDTKEDFAFVQRVYDHFGHDCFSWRDVLSVLKEHPEWLEINRHIEQNPI